jgi:hypothetical protein
MLYFHSFEIKFFPGIGNGGVSKQFLHNKRRILRISGHYSNYFLENKVVFLNKIRPQARRRINTAGGFNRKC